MRQVLYLLLLSIPFLLSQGCTFQALKADKFLEKGEMAKAKKRIDKAYEKEAKNPATQFMLAKYFSHPVWSYDAVDSAHLYIQLVRDTFPDLEVEVQKKLAKKGLDSTAIAEQALIIDSLAFEKAQSKNTEKAYNDYLNNYQYLLYADQATALRNQVAYEAAITENTTQAVSEFFKKYPDAPQAQKARNVFETLYFEKKTQNKAVSEYVEYVEERPQTEFAEEAAFEILNIISAGAEKSDYQRFINEYSRFRASNMAQSILDGLMYKENAPTLLTHKKDSFFYFYNLDEQRLLSFQFDNVMADSCFFIQEPYILRNHNNVTQAYLKSGERLYKSNLKAIRYLESGFFVVNDFGREENLIHYSQKMELQQKATAFQALGEFHFAKKDEDGWHLISLLNEPILKQAVDTIWKEDDIFFFRKGDDIAVASYSYLQKNAKNDLKSLSFLYDEYEWLDTKYLRLYSNDYRTVINAEAQVIFPLEKAEFEYLGKFWVKEKEGEISILDENKNSVFEESLDDYQFKSGVLAVQKDSLWSIFTDGIKGFPKFQYDSIRIFNSWLSYASQDSSEYLLFQSGKKVQLQEKESYRILKNYNVAFSHKYDEIRFVEISNQQGYFKLFNGFGRMIKEGEKLDINILTPKLIQIHQNKKKMLIDSAGNEIKIKNVDAFGAYENGLVPILQNRKFGAFVVDSLEIIPAHSESKLEVFLQDSLYVFKEDNLLGLSDANGEVVLEADFTTIDFFNDSLAIVEEEGEIAILNIYSNEYLYESIDTWKKLDFGDGYYFLIRKEAGFGVIDKKGAEIIPFIFNELQAYKSKGRLFWLAERRLSEINYIVIAYFDKSGKVLFKEGLNFDDFLETACD